jgi:hypothetical protein
MIIRFNGLGFIGFFLFTFGLSTLARGQEHFLPFPFPVYPIEVETNVWVPDYYAGQVYLNQLYRINDETAETAAEKSSYFRFRQMNFATPECSPNSVAVSDWMLYVVCGDTNKILVYSLVADLNSPTLIKVSNTALAVITHSAFNGLLAIAFDNEGNLWVSSYNNGMLFRVPFAQLKNVGSSTPTVDRSVTVSLGGNANIEPVGIAVDPSDHSFWVVGQFTNSSGFVANYSDSALNNGSTTPTATSCMTYEPPNGVSCTRAATASYSTPNSNLFINPEGVAITGNSIWVSNNGGSSRGSTIVRFTENSAHELSNPVVFGKNPSEPFACPGGMFAETSAGPLWVNDEGYDNGSDCGSTSSDQGQQVGRVLNIPLKSLSASHPHNPAPWEGGAWNVIRTGSPGFGGIFVQDMGFLPP